MKIKCTVELEYDIPIGSENDIGLNINNIRRDMTEWMLKEWQRVNITKLEIE